MMGWFLRKSFRLGPLRFNLSKSGVGVSAGVKGARIGVDARGRGYVAGGRGGLYFRQRLSAAPSTYEAGLPETLRPQLPLALAGSIVVLLAVLVVQFQGAVCAVADVAFAILSKRGGCAPHAPVFGVYFLPILGVGVLLLGWWVLRAARRDAAIRRWVSDLAAVDRRPMTREELRGAMGPRDDRGER
jgi:hypothetical protein